MNKRYRVPEIPESEQTPTVKMLLLLLEQFAQRIHEQDEEIARLKDEINRLKGQPPKPTFKGNLQSGLEGKEKTQKGRQNKKRPGSINFLGLLRSGESDYQLTESALSYMKAQKLPLWLLTRLHLQVGTGSQTHPPGMRFSLRRVSQQASCPHSDGRVQVRECIGAWIESRPGHVRECIGAWIESRPGHYQ